MQCEGKATPDKIPWVLKDDARPCVQESRRAASRDPTPAPVPPPIKIKMVYPSFPAAPLPSTSSSSLGINPPSRPTMPVSTADPLIEDFLGQLDARYQGKTSEISNNTWPHSSNNLSFALQNWGIRKSENRELISIARLPPTCLVEWQISSSPHSRRLSKIIKRLHQRQGSLEKGSQYVMSPNDIMCIKPIQLLLLYFYRWSISGVFKPSFNLAGSNCRECCISKSLDGIISSLLHSKPDPIIMPSNPSFDGRQCLLNRIEVGGVWW